MTIVELAWRASGAVAEDHGYHLYSAISHRLRSEIHDRHAWAIGPMDDRMCLRLRCPLDLAPVFTAALAGAELEVCGGHLRLEGGPELRVLRPWRTLTAIGVQLGEFRSRAASPEEFGEALGRRLAGFGLYVSALGVRFELGAPRRAMIFGRAFTRAPVAIEGYAVTLHGLPDPVSLRIQEEGLGGRRRMGWGWFE